MQCQKLQLMENLFAFYFDHIVKSNHIPKKQKGVFFSFIIEIVNIFFGTE